MARSTIAIVGRLSEALAAWRFATRSVPLAQSSFNAIVSTTIIMCSTAVIAVQQAHTEVQYKFVSYVNKKKCQNLS